MSEKRILVSVTTEIYYTAHALAKEYLPLGIIEGDILSLNKGDRWQPEEKYAAHFASAKDAFDRALSTLDQALSLVQDWTIFMRRHELVTRHTMTHLANKELL
jgi:hypothetical protein